VEESKFCLFWVVFPVRCISSVSPRFYFRRHTFSFLPLAAILESPENKFFKKDYLGRGKGPVVWGKEDKRG
jgi:hypothetical protein